MPFSFHSLNVNVSRLQGLHHLHNYAIEEGIELEPIYWPQSSGHDVSESG